MESQEEDREKCKNFLFLQLLEVKFPEIYQGLLHQISQSNSEQFIVKDFHYDEFFQNHFKINNFTYEIEAHQ